VATLGVVLVLAVYASVMVALGNPVHGLLFGGHDSSTEDVPVVVHLVRDGLLALSGYVAAGCGVTIVAVISGVGSAKRR